MVNGIESLISLSDSSLLVCRNASDFCVLILYPATLPNSRISFSNSLIIYLGPSMYSIMSCTNSESFTSSFPIYHWFLFFFSLIAIARISESVLNNSGERCHPCLLPHLRGNTFSISSLRIMFVMGLSYMTFKYVEAGSFCAHLFEEI